jgi:hypothetical protein
MSTWVDRLIQEKDELEEKIEKLEQYLRNSPEVSSEYFNILLAQHRAMREYYLALDVRVEMEEDN